MPIVLTGEVGVTGIESPAWATGTAPSNGDDVDAPPIDALFQLLLNNDAELAYEVFNRDQYLLNRLATGARFIESVTSIADLKARSSPLDGQVCMVKDPTITGTDVSRLGMFVFDLASSTTECILPASVDSYLVVTPNSGVGRWFNVAAGLGWTLGTAPRFLPRGKRRSGVEQASSNSGTPSTKTDLGGYVPLGVAVMLDGAVCRYDTDLQIVASVSVKSGSMADFFDFRIECSIDGGAWSAVPGTERRMGGGSSNNVWMPLTIHGYDNIESDYGRAYRLTADFPDSATLSVSGYWTMQATWHWDGA